MKLTGCCKRNHALLNARQVDILILGAGPTGLGAATRLHQHGRTDWLLVDQVCDGLFFAGTLHRSFAAVQLFKSTFYILLQLRAGTGGAMNMRPVWTNPPRLA